VLYRISNNIYTCNQGKGALYTQQTYVEVGLGLGLGFVGLGLGVWLGL